MFGESGIYQKLKDDHEEASELLEQLTETSDGDFSKREKLFMKLREALTLHSEAEDKIFYSKLLDHDATRDQILEAQEEHQLVEELLDELAELGFSSAEWAAKLKVLKENVEHHVDEEENEIFAQAKKVLDDDQAERLGNRFEEEKKTLRHQKVV